MNDFRPTPDTGYAGDSFFLILGYGTKRSMASLEAADPGDCRRSPAPIRRIRAHGAKFVDGDGAHQVVKDVKSLQG